MALDQEVVDNAGIGNRFDARIGSLEKRQDGLLDQSAELAKKQGSIAESEASLIEARGKETAAPREAVIARARQLPSSEVKEEAIPTYHRPTMDPKEFHDTFATMMVASLLMGVAGRSPFTSTMTAMTGIMDGFAKADDKIVAESLKTFDTNLAVIKERNNQKRRAVEDAWKKYSNDLAGLKLELELIAAKYDDPLAQQAARSKSLTDTQKLIDANIRSIDAAIARMEQTRASVEASRARAEEARARSLQSEERLRLARERAEKVDADRAARLDSSKFKNEQALRKEYVKDAAPIEKDLTEVNRILYYADHPQAFSDVQLRQAVSQFQKGARGTNAMIASMTNFGSLDERIAGHFTRFFEGTYEPEQRADIKNLFTGLRDKVLAPSLALQQEQFTMLANKHGFDPKAIIMQGAPIAAPDDDSSTEVPVTVTPR